MISPVVRIPFLVSLLTAGAAFGCSSDSKEATAPAEAKPTEAKPTEAKPAEAKPAAEVDPAIAYAIVPGEQVGPVKLGMTRAAVDALGILKPHPQYSAMTLPYTVYYDGDTVSSVELSLMHAADDIRVGDLTIPKSSSSAEVVALLKDCGEPNVAIGGTSTPCRSGGLHVSVGSGNPDEVWLRVYAADAE